MWLLQGGRRSPLRSRAAFCLSCSSAPRINIRIQRLGVGAGTHERANRPPARRRRHMLAHGRVFLLTRRFLWTRHAHTIRPHKEDPRWPGWQLVVGIEVHAQIKSRRKLFSGESYTAVASLRNILKSGMQRLSRRISLRLQIPLLSGYERSGYYQTRIRRARRSYFLHVSSGSELRFINRKGSSCHIEWY